MSAAGPLPRANTEVQQHAGYRVSAAGPLPRANTEVRSAKGSE